ncbi:metallophosphoesterase family protein [Candidatus Bipolaricaulota bacterium]|nr:metallophosphoesterase family protein [Candidatus Bipolaricaulota bacterium]
MMRIGLISDVHANLPALEAVLLALSKRGVERVICCGDLVDYAPWPTEVIARLREMDVLSVQGNHDAAVAGVFPIDGFAEEARVTVDWTRAVLSPVETAYLAELEQIHREEGFVIVHGSLRGPLWEYVRDAFVATESFSSLTRQLCFFGHSHIQGGYMSLAGNVKSIDSHVRLSILPGAKYLINPGSVGQPRDGDPRAAYAVVDLDNGHGSVSFERVSYDIGSVIRAIDRAGLPHWLGERLAIGR